MFEVQSPGAPRAVWCGGYVCGRYTLRGRNVFLDRKDPPTIKYLVRLASSVVGTACPIFGGLVSTASFAVDLAILLRPTAFNAVLGDLDIVNGGCSFSFAARHPAFHLIGDRNESESLDLIVIKNKMIGEYRL